MEAKLTIKLERSVIQSAKKYTANNNRSLSKLVEDYLRKLISEDEPQKQYSPLVEELSGVISEKELKKEIKNKYGDMVIMSIQTYEKSLFLNKVYEKLEEAKLDLKNKKVCKPEDSVKRIKEKYGL